LSGNRILVTGASGQVGGAAIRALAGLGEVIAPGRARLDLTSAESIRALMRDLQPRWVVNAAAHTAVDKAESEPELAFAINAEAPRVFGEEARKIGAAVIHFSTDYVFDGSGEKAWAETDATAPLNVYGKSKLAGEQALAATGAAHFILRTSWVYGATGKNFLLSIVRMAREREVLRIVADQHGAPTWSVDLARLTAHVIGRVNPSDAAGLSGVYHAGGGGETTWFGFASAAVNALRQRESGERLARVEPISTAEYPTPARRPANSRLNCAKLERTFGWRMMDWRESLERVMDEVAPT
jgi:dTDP-4-dehydrorhamnose reductase